MNKKWYGLTRINDGWKVTGNGEAGSVAVRDVRWYEWLTGLPTIISWHLRRKP